jgi:hypothetical protein
MLATAGPAVAAPSSPPRPAAGSPHAVRSPQDADTITAVVVRSWSGCGSGSVIWDTLNANWSSYGSIPISIDYSDPDLCSGTITYAALVASGADVVILSDPAGGQQQLHPAEFTALHEYANLGHTVIGTYLTFFWSGAEIDNSGLGRLFGFPFHGSYLAGEQVVTPTYDLATPMNPLFRDVPNPYVSSGFNETQVPASGTWDAAALKKANEKASTADDRAVISIFSAKRYTAIYISSMPEYGGGTADQQFFYNAITYPQTGA